MLIIVYLSYIFFTVLELRQFLTVVENDISFCIIVPIRFVNRFEKNGGG